MKKLRVVGKCLLLDLLNQRHMTQADLHVLTGISRTQINAYIKEERYMSLLVAKVIASVLKCHIDDLYKWNFYWE